MRALLIAAAFTACAPAAPKWVVLACPDVPNPVLFGPISGIGGRSPSPEVVHRLLPWAGVKDSISTQNDGSTYDRTRKIQGSMEFATAVLKSLTPKLAWEEDYRLTDVVRISDVLLNRTHVAQYGSSGDTLALLPVGDYYHWSPHK